MPLISEDDTVTSMSRQCQAQPRSVPSLPPEVLEMIWQAYCPAFSHGSRIVDLILKIYSVSFFEKYLHIFASKRLVVRMRQLWHIMAIHKATRQRALRLFPDSLSVRNPYTNGSCTILLNKKIDLIMLRDFVHLDGDPVASHEPVLQLLLDAESSFFTASQEDTSFFNPSESEFYFASDQVLDVCRPTTSFAMRSPADLWTLSFLEHVTLQLFPRLETVFLCSRIETRRLSIYKRGLSWCVSGQVRQEALTPVTKLSEEPFVACWPNLQTNSEFANAHMPLITEYPKPPTLRSIAKFLESHNVRVWPMVLYQPRLMLPDYLRLQEAESKKSL